MGNQEINAHLLDYPPDENYRKRSSHNIDIDKDIATDDGPLIMSTKKLSSVDIDVEPLNSPFNMAKQKPSWKNFAMLLALCT